MIFIIIIIIIVRNDFLHVDDVWMIIIHQLVAAHTRPSLLVLGHHHHHHNHHYHHHHHHLHHLHHQHHHHYHHHHHHHHYLNLKLGQRRSPVIVGEGFDDPLPDHRAAGH